MEWIGGRIAPAADFGARRLGNIHHDLCGRHCRLSFLFEYFELLGALCPVRKLDPRRFRATAALAHMIESRSFRLDPRLFGAGEEEVGVRKSDAGPGQAYSASPDDASAGWSFAGSAVSAASTALRFVALVLPRSSCLRS